jgi:hypothetical protein
MPDGTSALLRRLEELERAVGQLRGSVAASNAPVVLKAVTAQSAADVAQANAEAAQTTADTANDAAEQASTDAAAASTTAQNANTAAQQAAQQAQAAQTAAASKTKTTWSASAPTSSTPGTVDGDTWYVTNGTGGAAVAQYRWSASTTTWVQTAIDGSVLQNVVADTVKAGAIDGQVITGATVRSAASGQRAEVVSNRINFYNPAGAQGGYVIGSTTTWAGVDYPAIGMGGGGAGVVVTGPIPYVGSAAGAGADFKVTTQIQGDTVLGRCLFATNTGSTGLFYLSGSDAKAHILLALDPTSLQWTLNAGLANITGAVKANDYQKLDGTSILPVTGTFTSLDTAWTITATLTKQAKVVTLFYVARRTNPIAANSQADVLQVQSGYAPSVLTLLPGIAWSYSAPYTSPVQIATDGKITVFTTTAGAQTVFSGTLQWQAA